jgi:hypothetical protein
MNINNIAFPHPVLGIGDSINSSIELPPPEINSGTDSYEVTVSFTHDNLDLLNLVDSGKAEYFCEATCSNTVYRKIFTSKESEITFTIPKKYVKSKVEFTCLLVATEAISNYSNTEAHPDYTGYTFDIDKGDILAYFGEFSFNADIRYEKLKAVSSFMEIVENEGEEFTTIDLKRSKIRVELPSESYQIYLNDSISQEERFAPIFHSSIVLNALLVALFNFDDEHKEYTWAQVIEYRLKNEPQFSSLSVDDRVNIPEIAQRLLGNPFQRLIKGLNSFENSTEE